MADAVRICSRDDVAPGSARRFDVQGHRVALVRIGDDFYAIGDECSHADYSLSAGDVWEEECEIECPKHGSTFSLETGEPQTLPAPSFASQCLRRIRANCADRWRQRCQREHARQDREWHPERAELGRGDPEEQ